MRDCDLRRVARRTERGRAHTVSSDVSEYTVHTQRGLYALESSEFFSLLMSLLHNYTRPLRLPPNHPVSSFGSLLSACQAPVLCFETLLRYAVVPVRSGDAGAAGDRTGVALEAGQARLAVAVGVTVTLALVALASATSIHGMNT